ncbi:MAG: tetratricopeptide repeat protein [Mariprofundales bacterium]|nr:tetratricopeptide repeat protein [Mariprofundales bacterium]
MPSIVASLLALLLLAGCAGKSTQHNILKQGEVHYEMGVDALRKQNLPLAFRELLKAQSFLPDSAKVNAALALAWRYRGDLDRSAELYRRALRIKSVPATHNNYGSLLLQRGRLQQAEKQFRMALDDPRYVRQDMVLINLGDLYAAQGRYDDAIASYRRAGLINPAQNISKLREAAAFIASNRESYAEALLLTLLRQQPTSRAALEELLPLLQQHHNRAEARRLLINYGDLSAQPSERGWAQQQLESVEGWHE